MLVRIIAGCEHRKRRTMLFEPRPIEVHPPMIDRRTVRIISIDRIPAC